MSSDLKQAYALTIGSAFCYSLIPLATILSGSAEKPLTLGAGFLFGSGLSMAIMQKTLLYPKKTVLPTYGNILNRCLENSNLLLVIIALILITMDGLGYALFFWSTSYIDVAISNSLFEIWPLTAIIYFLFIDRFILKKGIKKDTVSRPNYKTYLLMLLSIPAIVLVVLSAQSNSVSGDYGLPIFGIILALLAPIVGSLYVFSFLFTNQLIYDGKNPNWESKQGIKYNLNYLTLHLNITSAVLSRFMLLPLALILGIFESNFSLNDMMMPLLGGIIIGFFLHSPADIMLRKSHLKSIKREILLLQYMSPILTIAWLFMFLKIDIPKLHLFIIGTVAIVVLNILIAYRFEKNKNE